MKREKSAFDHINTDWNIHDDGSTDFSDDDTVMMDERKSRSRPPSFVGGDSPVALRSRSSTCDSIQSGSSPSSSCNPNAARDQRQIPIPSSGTSPKQFSSGSSVFSTSHYASGSERGGGTGPPGAAGVGSASSGIGIGSSPNSSTSSSSVLRGSGSASAVAAAAAAVAAAGGPNNAMGGGPFSAAAQGKKASSGTHALSLDAFISQRAFGGANGANTLPFSFSPFCIRFAYSERRLAEETNGSGTTTHHVRYTAPCSTAFAAPGR